MNNINIESNTDRVNTKDENCRPNQSLAASIWAELQTATGTAINKPNPSLSETIWSDVNTGIALASPLLDVAAYGIKKLDDAANYAWDHRGDQAPTSVPEKIPFEQTSQVKEEAHKIEELHSKTLFGDDKTRAEALTALKDECAKLGGDPDYKAAVVDNLQSHLGKSLNVELDAQGNPQTLLFESAKQIHDQDQLNKARQNNDQRGMDTAQRELTMDAIGGGEVVSVLSPGQTRITYLR